MLDLGRLRALHAVARHGSVGAAATALGYTPSAVSQQIAKLERETRTTLLERRGRGVALTDAAHLLAATADQVLKLVEHAEVTLEEQRGAAVGELRVGAFATAARGLLPAALVALARDHPALDLRLVETDPPQGLEAVARGELDMAVTHDWVNAPLAVPEGVSRTQLGEDLADVLLPAGHPLADRAVLVPQDLAGERWICQPEGTICHDWLVNTVRGAGMEPDLAYRIAEYDTQLALLAAGIGVALLPRLGRGPLPASVRAVPFTPTPTRRVFAVWRAQATRRPAVVAALDALRNCWGDRSTA
ncbi:LysR family transcriptional regulator [Saccharothrix algeriensis]|uniref:DNA-binding transcriptional LysR family regulator n=1 Tax=Saccharothrix algeriensis TaxID=173560 RepID=A0A8T8HTY0_9PSEU|nr:LysR family transcriptional regulator [Saccharothrix algeriensis]MBM7813425.1 DNA-binding transcriptional LysR family regulator [Saccharothrix algeriensis]QTR01946.1 LysR family transcriptional regulator [Saccharothrix algeriensis]